MIAKTFEVRDKGTFLPVLAVCLVTDNEGDRYLMARCGYGTTGIAQSEHIMITRLRGESNASADEYHWRDRTMTIAHQYIRMNFHELENGAVVYVEHINEETPEPKKSERFDV